MMRYKSMAIIAISGIALLVSSCNIYRPYSRPQMNTAGLYRDTVSVKDTLSVRDTVNMGNFPWEQVFTDVKLQALIRQGLANNLDLQTATLRVQEYMALFKASQLAFLPTFSLAPQGGLSKAEGVKLSKTFSLPLSASWEIDLFGKLLNAKRGAKAAMYQSEAYRQAIRSQVVAGIANSYYALLMFDRQLAISEQTARNWELTVQMMKTLKELGNVNEAAVVQSEANYYAVVASLPSLRRQIREMENTLSLLLGEAGQTIDRGMLEEQQFPVALSVGIPLQLVSNRPDVKAAEMGLMGAAANTNVARASMYPNLSIGANGAWTNSLGGAIVSPAKFLATATAQLVQPLFAGGKLRAQLKVAKAQQEEARLAFQQVLLTAGNEVSNALFQYKSSGDISASLNSQVISLQKAVDYTKQLLRLGTSTYLEVITAEQSLLTARLTEVQNRYDQIQAVVYLYQALGGGR